jgi:hypothetical protein
MFHGVTFRRAFDGRVAGERQLRARPASVLAARDAGAERVGDPVVADVGVRGVHPLGAEAGRHAAAGPRGRLRRAARERGLDPAAAPRRAGGAAERVGVRAARRAADADRVQQQRVGLVRLGLGRRRRRSRARHPQPRRPRGPPRVRPAHRLRRRQDAQPASPHKQ